MMRFLLFALALAVVAGEMAAPANPVQKTIDGLFKTAPKLTLTHDLERLDDDEAEVPMDEAEAPEDEAEVPEDEDEAPEFEAGVPEDEAGVPEDEAEVPRDGDDDPPPKTHPKAEIQHATAVTNNLERELEESALPRDTRKMAKDIISGIRHDLYMIPSVSSSKKAKLVQAASLRIKAAKQLLLADKDITSASRPSGKAARVAGDTATLASKIRSSHMPSATKHEALDNLKVIKRDAEELTHATNAHKRHNLKEALSLRMSALKKEMGKPSHSRSRPSSSRVLEDTQKLMREVRSSGMSKADKDMAMGNLEEISRDTEMLSSTSDSGTRAHMKKALGFRIAALKKQLGVAKSDKEPICSGVACKRVQSDVRALEERVQTARLSASKQKETMSNLDAIARDATKLSSGGMSASKRAKVKQALQLRMLALKDELGTASSACSGVACKVEKDVRHLEERLGSTELSAAAKREVKANLDTIAKDAKLLSSAVGHKKETLHQAIQLRMNALKTQLGTNAPTKASASAKHAAAAPKHAKHAAAAPKHAKHAAAAPKHAAAAPKHAKTHASAKSAEQQVMQDLDKMEAKIEAMSGVSKKVKKDMEENMHAIAKDSKRLSSATTKKKTDLQKAIKYRMKALKSEISGIKA